MHRFIGNFFTKDTGDDPRYPPGESNKPVNELVRQAEQLQHAKLTRKRGSYLCIGGELKAKIGRFAAEFGNTNAVKKFGNDVGGSLSESTVRSFKKKYLKELKETGNPPTHLSHGLRGRPLLLQNGLDDKVLQYVTKLRAAGCPVNRTVLIAATKGIIMSQDPSLLSEHGGHISLSRRWAQSFLSRHNYVQRKVTKAARKLPPDFENVQKDFYQRLTNICKQNDITQEMADLVVNIDQTCVKLIPSSDWTLNKQGKLNNFYFNGTISTSTLNYMYN